MEPVADPLRRHAAALASLARSGFAVGGTLADAAPVPLDPLARTARALAFWAAVALPFLHLPFLLASGVTADTTPLLVTLWTLHAVGLVVGAGHSPHQ